MCGLCAAVLLSVLAAAAADVIFRVPEVLVRHAAAPRPVGTGSRGNGTELPDGALLEVRYEEYYVEHEISTAEAKKAAKELDLDNLPAVRLACGACSRRELEYCETRVLADHCCCERRYVPEPFAWLPHTCYVGPHRCRPLAHDCVRYTKLRDCCCYRQLAQRWKGILSGADRLAVRSLPYLVLSLLTVALL